MANQKMVMDQIHQNHLISNIEIYFFFKYKNILFRKMFIGGLSWQTAPGK
jgi:hypothetical protein